MSPHLERSFIATNLTENMSLEARLRVLHHLYRVSCLAVALATIAQVAFVEKEIGSVSSNFFFFLLNQVGFAIHSYLPLFFSRPLLFDMKNPEVEAEYNAFMLQTELEVERVITHACTTPLKNLTAQLDK